MRGWGRLLVIACGLSMLPGCHLLLRLGEQPAPQKPVPEEERPPAERPSPPSAGPETPSPPVPGLSPEEPSPPAPGISPEMSQSPNRERRAGSRERTRKTAAAASPTRRLIGNTGINTNTALAPGEGQYVYRTQLRFQQAHSSPGPVDLDVNLLANPHVLAYGYRQNLTLFGVLPFVLREGTARPPMPPGAFLEIDDQGLADPRFFAKYRFWEKDRPGETWRWSAIGGIEVPSYDEPFTSDSWDPFLGTVWTYQSQEWGLDLDWLWKFNTGAGLFRHDRMRYDAAYTYVLLQGQDLNDRFWQLNGVLELNGFYFTEGSHLVFAAPGLQLALPRMIVEGSLQLPVIRDLKGRVEPDLLLAVGTRITW